MAGPQGSHVGASGSGASPAMMPCDFEPADPADYLVPLAWGDVPITWGNAPLMVDPLEWDMLMGDAERTV
jgi:hypothetical protein